MFLVVTRPSLDGYGLDQFITKNIALTHEEEVDACPIRTRKLSVSPVVRVDVRCKVVGVESSRASTFFELFSKSIYSYLL